MEESLLNRGKLSCTSSSHQAPDNFLCSPVIFTSIYVQYNIQEHFNELSPPELLQRSLEILILGAFNREQAPCLQILGKLMSKLKNFYLQEKMRETWWCRHQVAGCCFNGGGGTGVNMGGPLPTTLHTVRVLGVKLCEEKMHGRDQESHCIRCRSSYDLWWWQL